MCRQVLENNRGEVKKVLNNCELLRGISSLRVSSFSGEFFEFFRFRYEFFESVMSPSIEFL